MTDPTPAPTLTPAAQNPWYLLATLYGEPESWGDEKRVKNRVAWNRYYASHWTDKQRAALKGRVDAAELVPFSDAELSDIRQRFRTKAGEVQVEMPGASRVIDFKECQFDQAVFFGRYVFGRADFSSATFSGDADFSSATFSGDADFSSVTVSGYADFSHATFSGCGIFSSATFSFSTDFSRATFSENAPFDSVTFSGLTFFGCVTFTGDAYFSRATFSGLTSFGSVTFTGDAYFSRAAFSEPANFSSATFHQQARFTNSEMKSPTDFQDCRFLGEPPRFHGGKLHEDTVWRGVTWPVAPTDPDKAGRFTDAYERLKQEMDRLKKHEDELMFFAKELACRRVARGQVRGLPIGAYGVLCHYGQSYMLPLGWLTALILVGAVQFWPVLNWDFLLALGVSTANTLGPLGLRKEMMDAGTLPLDLSRWLRFLSGAQMVIGLILLFLIGLGLRNRFRMK